MKFEPDLYFENAEAIIAIAESEAIEVLRKADM